MHGRTLSGGLHRGRQVQMRLVKRVYDDVGEEYQHNQQKRGEISPGELRHSGTCNLTRIYIFSTRHLGQRRRVRRSGEDDSGNLFSSSFLQKYENRLPCRRSSKYDAVQEIRTGTPESSDIGTREVIKFHEGEHRTGTGRGGRRGILQCRTPPYLK